MEWLDRKGMGHHVASCPCWRCHLFRLIGLVSAGRLAEAESRFEPKSVKLSTRLELPQPRKAAETAEALALRRRWLILGVVLVGSFMAVLDVFIVTQGLPSIKTTLGAGVSDLELVVSAYSLVYAVFLITGNIVGGLLIQLNLAGLAWRPIFLVNVPVGIFGVLTGFLVLHPSRAERAPKLDLPGVGLISLFLVSLILPLAEGQQMGWPTWMILLLIASLPLLGVFVLYERRRTDAGADPLVDMDLFKHRSFAVGMPLVIFYYVGATGLFFTFVLFLQSGLGFSPIDSGLAFPAINTAFITASLLGPRLIPRLGNRLLSFAYALQAAGLIWTMFTVTSSGTGLTLYELAAPLIVFGLGAGFALSPLLGIILSGVPSQDVGAASGVVSTSMQIGNTVGISLFGLLFYRFLNSQLSSTPVSYLDSFKLTLPFLIIPSISSFLIVFLLSQHRARQIIHRLVA